METATTDYSSLVSYLEGERSLLQAVIDQMPSGLYIAEAPSGKILLRNREADRLLGHPPYERYEDFGAVHADGTPYRREEYPICRTLENGETIDQKEMNYRRPDGNLIHLSVSAAPVRDQAGRIRAGVVVFTDISERKKVENELADSRSKLVESLAELAHVNAQLAEYAYVVSHDLKAPLRAIRNYVDFLSEDLADKLEEEQKRYLEGLLQATFQGEELINDLLDFSRIGRVPHKIEPVDLAELCDEILSVLDVPSNAKIILPSQWPMVRSDRVLLHQILQNLMSNALKFGPKDEPVVEVGWGPAAGGRFEVYLRDNGIGIDPCYWEQIFGIFKRLHSGNEYPGTGIGLAIVKKAAGLLGGSVRLESTPGKGSTFYVNLPLRHDVADD